MDFHNSWSAAVLPATTVVHGAGSGCHNVIGDQRHQDAHTYIYIFIIIKKDGLSFFPFKVVGNIPAGFNLYSKIVYIRIRAFQIHHRKGKVKIKKSPL